MDKTEAKLRRAVDTAHEQTQRLDREIADNPNHWGLRGDLSFWMTKGDKAWEELLAYLKDKRARNE